MKNKILHCLFATVLFITFFSCHKEEAVEEKVSKPFLKGDIDTTLTIQSSMLDRMIHYSVYLPPGYTTSNINYPVLYLLHGMTEDHRTWAKMGTKDVMDSYINKDESKPMIVVMPQAFNSFYINSIDEATGISLNYEDFLINEFFPNIEKKYRIKTGRNNTSIAGNSMGGFGATYLSYKYNEKFGSSYSMGGALFIDYLKEVVETKTSEQLKKLPDYVMEVGTEDFLTFNFNEEFNSYLNTKEIQHTYKKRSGGHENWIDYLPNALSLAGKCFD